MTFKPIIAVMVLAPTAASAQMDIPDYDAFRAAFSQTGNMDIGKGGGEMDISRFEMRALLSHPVSPIEGLRIIPVAEYSLTSLNFDGTPAGFPIHDEDLHSLGLSAYAIRTCEGSPWIYGGWARGELASDFQHIDGDDFTFDVAAGVGYRFNDCFTLGVGGTVININGDAAFYPGINFDWIASDQLRIGLYGPTFLATWMIDEDWLLSLRGDPGGGVWNITDDSGKSRSIDLTSYRLGLYASRRLTGKLWLTAGGGMTLGNEIDYDTPHGTEIFSREPDQGFFGQVSVRLTAW